MTQSFLEEMVWRGFVYDKTEGLEGLMAEEKISGYIGFDPTSDSLHAGNLLTVMGLVHLQRHGHRPIGLVGGATGMIGDPSGKSKERNLLGRDQLAHNQACIKSQLERFLDFDVKTNPAMMVNNADWLGKMNFIEFLRDVGKYFTVNTMMAKESVKRRIEGEDGISYTEFSYMLLQAYDFYHLYRTHGCRLQMGGSDQWGNITAGTDLIRRLAESKAHGLVFPLLTNASGGKFGKTEEGAIWLDAERTSPYRFYQFWLNKGDEESIKYLKVFTLLDREAIEALAAESAAAPHQRIPQKRLAAEVTRVVHGETALDKVLKASKAMFGGSFDALSAREVGEIFEDVPSSEFARTRFEGEGIPVLEVAAESGLTKSKGEARRLLQGGGMYVNNQRLSDVDHRLRLEHALEGQFIVLRKGGKSYHLIKLIG